MCLLYGYKIQIKNGSRYTRHFYMSCNANNMNTFIILSEKYLMKKYQNTPANVDYVAMIIICTE